MAVPEEHLSFEEAFQARFGSYAREVILDRAIPDARDGLKPSQRRILFGMSVEGHTPDRPYVKSARIVGDVLGRLHPHGDASVYATMVRMSQWWVCPSLVDLQGNGGSLDDDPPAAARYTEARLNPLAMELVRDIAKDTVRMVPTFDESGTEPEVLPAYFPNLLVGGASGIAVGFACDILPHNLGEAIDAAIALANNPATTADDLLALMPGPDFPTGGIIVGHEGAATSERTGYGKMVLRAKLEPGETKGGRTSLIVTEIPYRTVKARLVEELDQLRASRTLDGFMAVRDESDHEAPVRIALEFRSDVDVDTALEFLYQNTGLQTSITSNMTAIVGRRPQCLGSRDLLLAYLEHLREVVTRRTRHDLKKAEERLLVLDGLIRACADIDEIVREIRRSKSRRDAQARLMGRWGFTVVQADAILTLQLYRLSGLEVEAFRREAAGLEKDAAAWRGILADPKRLTATIVSELEAVKAKFATPRRTEIAEGGVARRRRASTFKAVRAAEDVVVAVTFGMDLKRVPPRSYQRADAPGLREGDVLRWVVPTTTRERVAFLFEDGSIFSVEAEALGETKWRDLGLPLVNIIPSANEHGRLLTVAATGANPATEVVAALGDGQVRRLAITTATIPQRAKGGRFLPPGAAPAVAAFEVQPTDRLFLLSRDGQTLLTGLAGVPVQGAVAGGVRGLRLRGDDRVVAGCPVPADADRVLLLGERGGLAAVSVADYPQQNRGGAGVVGWSSSKRSPEAPAAVVAFKCDMAVAVVLTTGIATVAAGAVPVVKRGALASSRMPGALLTARVVQAFVPG